MLGLQLQAWTDALTQSWVFKLSEAELNSVVEWSLEDTRHRFQPIFTQQASDHCLGLLLLVTPTAGAPVSLARPKTSK